MTTTTDPSTDLPAAPPPAQLPPTPPGGVTAGVDWASTDHAVAIVDHTGTAIDRFSVSRSSTPYSPPT